MQRLLNMLRNSQSYCDDNGCVQDLPGPQGTPADGGFNVMMVMVAWLVVATALYLFRPGNLRQQGDEKPARFDNAGNEPPQPPPVA